MGRWCGRSARGGAMVVERTVEMTYRDHEVLQTTFGPVDLTRRSHSSSAVVDGYWESDARPMIEGLDWVICGGESGPNARPMHPAWACSIRDQCQAAGVPYFFKQWGEWAPFFDENGDHWDVFRLGKRRAGRLLDGRTWDEMPEARHG